MTSGPALRPALPPRVCMAHAGYAHSPAAGRLVGRTGAPSWRGLGGAVFSAPGRIAACGRYAPSTAFQLTIGTGLAVQTATICIG